MKKVLFVNGCIRGTQSRTLRLAQRLVKQIPDADIEVLALPALLMLFDPLTARLTLKSGFLKKTEKEVDVK